jgi:enoyl-CoA hydratase/carnithine racemase
MDYKLIDMQVDSAIATITFNRPDKRNAMSDDMRSEFIHALEGIASDKGIRALILTGAGKGFCAGGDISGMEKRMSAPTGEIAFNGWHRQQRVHHTQTLLYTMPKPTIAAVNGAASGLGADTALACDFLIGSEHANFTWSYINRGIIPDGGGMYFLPRRVGLSMAKQLIFTGRRVDIDEALALGIVDRKCSSENLLSETHAWARELSKASATALALSKNILNQTFEMTQSQVFAQGSQAQGICYTSSEHREAVMAFLEKNAAAKLK